jgi:hypothetical protein
VEEIHSKFTDRRPDGFVRIGLGITMSSKWIQDGSSVLLRLISALPEHHVYAPLIRGGKLY